MKLFLSEFNRGHKMCHAIVAAKSPANASILSKRETDTFQYGAYHPKHQHELGMAHKDYKKEEVIRWWVEAQNAKG